MGETRDFDNPGRPCRILITGIGCVGKSTLRRRVAGLLGDHATSVDKDDGVPVPAPDPDKVFVLESVHGLDEEKPECFDLVVYLMPPSRHWLRWVLRGLAWFRTGYVDRPPRTVRRPFSILNVPLITFLIARNLVLARRWVREDLNRLRWLKTRVIVTNSPEEALQAVLRSVDANRDR